MIIDLLKRFGVKDWHIFFALSIFAFLLLLGIYPFTMVGGDEGRFVQDALRIGRGEIPIADYGTRAPILSFFINLFTELFGRSLFIFRLPVLIFSALTAGFIFLLGKELFSRTIGVVASLVYMSTPFTLWHYVVIKSEALEVLLVTAAAWFLVRGVQSNKLHLFLFAGICMGFAFIDRQSAVAFMLASAFVVIWHAFQKEGAFFSKIKEIIIRGFGLISGVVIGIAPVFLFVAYHNWELAVRHWFNMYASVGFSLEEKETARRAAGSPFYQFVRAWMLMFVEVVAVQAGLIFAGFVIFLMGCVQVFTAKYRILRKVLLAGICVIFGGSLLFHSLNIFFVGTFRPYVFLSLLLFSLLLLSWLWYRLLFPGTLHAVMERYKQSLFFLLFWVISLIISYSFYIPGYPREFMPAFSLAAAFVLTAIPWKSLRVPQIGIFGICVLGLMGVGIVWFHNPIIGWWWRQETMEKTTEYIRVRTQLGDGIFTANPLPAILADRSVPADINPYAIYFSADADTGFGGYPSPHAYFALLQENPPSFALIDGRMEHHFFEKYPFFEEFVKNNYEHVATFGTGYKRDWTEVWQLVK